MSVDISQICFEMSSEEFSSHADVEVEPRRGMIDNSSYAFGRFANIDSAKWTAFPAERRREELQRFAALGSVTKRKAFFEEFFGKRKTLRASAEEDQKTFNSIEEGPVGYYEQPIIKDIQNDLYEKDQGQNLFEEQLEQTVEEEEQAQTFSEIQAVEFQTVFKDQNLKAKVILVEQDEKAQIVLEEQKKGVQNEETHSVFEEEEQGYRALKGHQKQTERHPEASAENTHESCIHSTITYSAGEDFDMRNQQVQNTVTIEVDSNESNASDVTQVKSQNDLPNNHLVSFPNEAQNNHLVRESQSSNNDSDIENKQTHANDYSLPEVNIQGSHKPEENEKLAKEAEITKKFPNVVKNNAARSKHPVSSTMSTMLRSSLRSSTNPLKVQKSSTSVTKTNKAVASTRMSANAANIQKDISRRNRSGSSLSETSQSLQKGHAKSNRLGYSLRASVNSALQAPSNQISSRTSPVRKASPVPFTRVDNGVTPARIKNIQDRQDLNKPSPFKSKCTVPRPFNLSTDKRAASMENVADKQVHKTSKSEIPDNVAVRKESSPKSTSHKPPRRIVYPSENRRASKEIEKTPRTPPGSNEIKATEIKQVHKTSKSEIPDNVAVRKESSPKSTSHKSPRRIEYPLENRRASKEIEKTPRTPPGSNEIKATEIKDHGRSIRTDYGRVFMTTSNARKSISVASTSEFRFRSTERAERRKEFKMKLEEKVNAKEAEKNQLQVKSKEDKEADMKGLRKKLTFKATPLPDFYHNSNTPKVEVKKIPATRANSAVLGKQSIINPFRGEVSKSMALPRSTSSALESKASSSPKATRFSSSCRARTSTFKKIQNGEEGSSSAPKQTNPLLASISRQPKCKPSVSPTGKSMKKTAVSRRGSQNISPNAFKQDEAAAAVSANMP